MYLLQTYSRKWSPQGFNRQENGPKAEQEEDRSNKARQNNKRADEKVETNDSPEIPIMGATSEILGLPSGWLNICCC